MSASARPFPDRPSLRYLKLEAKRRLAAGEFGTLHDAQLAIAREHGLPSWTALKEHIARIADRPAFTQVRWLLSRFRDAGSPTWAAPAEDELRAHFTDHYLRQVPPETVVRALARAGAGVGDEPVVAAETPLSLRAHVVGLRIEAAVEDVPPHRFTRLRVYAGGGRVTDPRLAAPITRTSGAVPEAAAAVAAESFAELGLPGLVLAGATPGAAGGRPGMWAVATGWADLGRGEELRPDHRFPAYAISKPVTATAVLRLVADGRIGLDDAANAHVRTLRLADDTITVRELLAHTGGVDSPREMFTDAAGGLPDVTALLGPVVACGGPRGRFAYGNGGYAVLGELVAGVTGVPYAEAVTRLVLEPLGMHDSSFPDTLPDDGAAAGHRLAGDGPLEPDPVRLCVVPAAGGLWTTAGDLVRFGLGWAGLLPRALAREALRPHADQPAGGARAGLGWMLNPDKDVAGHPAVGPGAAASLIVRASTGAVGVALTNRSVPIEPVNARLMRPIA